MDGRYTREIRRWIFLRLCELYPIHPIHLFLAASDSLAELSPLVKNVHLKTHKIAELDPNDLWELTRKCHLFRSLDLSGWTGVSVLAFRSLGLAVGASLEAVRQCGAGCARSTKKRCSRLIWSQTDHLQVVSNRLFAGRVVCR